MFGGNRLESQSDFYALDGGNLSGDLNTGWFPYSLPLKLSKSGVLNEDTPIRLTTSPLNRDFRLLLNQSFLIAGQVAAEPQSKPG